ncbi:MAG TPA: hypothetical protein VIC06_14315 [Solirubrobacteraceae bacterium]|jgi:hypothetical protein
MRVLVRVRGLSRLVVRGLLPVLFVAGAGVLWASGVALGAGDANRAGCGAGTEASPGFRGYLPDCRAFELVTPPYKGSAVVTKARNQPAAVSGDGSRVITGIGGAFAGAGNDWLDLSKNPNIDEYEFSRSGAGWAPTALTPPATQFPHARIMAASVDLGSTLWGAATTRALYNEDIYLRDDAGVFHPVGPGVNPEIAGQELADGADELNFVGASSDLSHSVFAMHVMPSEERVAHGGRGNMWPGDTTRESDRSLYEYVYGGARVSEPSLVGVRNQGVLRSDGEAQLISNCGTGLGSSLQEGSAYNAVSGDGGVVFFTASACEGSPVVNELYARVSGARTVAISEPSKEDCESCNTTSELKNAVFEGASLDGRKVFFLTEQALFPGQEGMNLYEYDFDAPPASAGNPAGRIRLVSGGSVGGVVGDPLVKGVSRVSEDGSHVYFVAKAVLAGANPEGASAEAGAENLYVYDTVSGVTVFVAKLLTPGEEAAIQTAEGEEQNRIIEEAVEQLSVRTAAAEHERQRGEITVEREQSLIAEAQEGFYEVSVGFYFGTRGPSRTLGEDRSVWRRSDERPVQATPDGRFLVFPSSARLTAGDESTFVPQLFEYDATTQRLTRVSIGQGGAYGNDGNVDTFRAAPQIPPLGYAEMDFPTGGQVGSVLSADGGRVFFTSAAGLAPQAAAGDTSVYEYREGDVYLVSGGQDASFSAQVGNPTVGILGASPSGGDVLFTTVEQLVPQDGETSMVLYDAREEGGFPAPVLAAGCVGETCRGSSGSAPQLPGAGSAGQTAGGNLTPPVEAKRVVKPRPRSSVRSRKLARALRLCSRGPRARRAVCVRRARKRFAAVSVNGHDRRGKR